MLTSKKLDHARSGAVTSLSPLELRALEREQRRSVLGVEQARVELEVLERGPDALSLSRMQLAYEKQKADYETLASQTELEIFELKSDLERVKLEESEELQELAEANSERDNCTMSAPTDGLCRTAVIWPHFSIACGQTKTARRTAESLIPYVWWLHFSMTSILSRAVRMTRTSYSTGEKRGRISFLALISFPTARFEPSA